MLPANIPIDCGQSSGRNRRALERYHGRVEGEVALESDQVIVGVEIRRRYRLGKLVTTVLTFAIGSEIVTGRAVGPGVGVGVGAGVGVGVGLAVGAGVGVGAAVMVKFVSEISKKILPTASTFIRAVVVGVLGIRTDSAAIVSCAGEKDGRESIATISRERNLDVRRADRSGGGVGHIPGYGEITCAGMLTAVLGAVTAKGPAALLTVTVLRWRC